MGEVVQIDVLETPKKTKSHDFNGETTDVTGVLRTLKVC